MQKFSDVPLVLNTSFHFVGKPIAENQKPDTFNQNDFEVLAAAAPIAGLAIEKARLLASERRRADYMDSLRTTITDITSELELSKLLHAIVERAAGLLDATSGTLGFYDEAAEKSRLPSTTIWVNSTSERALGSAKAPWAVLLKQGRC